MFSSLPSATKLYVSNAAKNKQKNCPPGVKKKRKSTKASSRNEIISQSPTEMVTLIASSSKDNSVQGSNLEYESDETTSELSSVVRFCTGGETEFDGSDSKHTSYISPLCSKTYNEDTNDEKLKFSDNTFINCIESYPSTSEEQFMRNEIQSVSDELNHQDSESSNEEQDDSNVNDGIPFNDSCFTDSPGIKIDFTAEEQNYTKIIEEPVIGNFLPDKFPSVKCDVYETINEEQECEETVEHTESNSNDNFDVACNIYEMSDALDIVTEDKTTQFDLPVSSDNSPDGMITFHENLAVEPLDSASIKSDCCPSNNIFDERTVEIVGEIYAEPDEYAVDEHKHNCLGDDSTNFSQSDPEDIENPRIQSPEVSEVSCTESTMDENKHICQNKDTLDTLVTTESSFDVAQGLGTIPSILLIKETHRPKHLGTTCSCTSLKTELKINKSDGVLSRTMSLPESYFQLLQTSSLSFEKRLSSSPIKSSLEDNSTSVNVSGTFQNYDPNIDCNDLEAIHPTEEPKSYIEQDLSHSCQNSVADLSTASSQVSSIMTPVATREARLRSFVVGSVRASGSLLGVEELLRYFPEKKVTVFVGTWNMNSQDPPKCINDFLLPLGVPYLADIYAIGVQESNNQSRSEWEVLMQTTLGPTHVLMTSANIGVLHLAIFLRRDLVWFCSEPEEAHVATRPGSNVKTKGAVAISFMFFGTSFLFINSHLTAHEGKLKERLADYEKICSMIDLPKNIPLKYQYQSKDVTSKFDNVFWCGDLNFRVVQNRPAVLTFIENKIKQMMPTCDFLLQHDQLHRAMCEGVAFNGFQEGIINFIPSYKFDIGTCSFDSIKQRVPSYTDRVLFRCKQNSSVCCVHYNAVPEILTSDHKPVFAVFEVQIKPGRDNIPLAAGLFKRDIYLEANRRRSMALEVDTNQKNSTICRIM